MEKEYYQKVNQYYNDDAAHFEQRYGENNLLKIIRESFRKETDPYAGKVILEIGFGPGFDLVYFANKYPNSEVFGIDISDEMVSLAKKNAAKDNLNTIRFATGSVEDISEQFPNVKFDLIYVYFGALNTVKDIERVPEFLKALLAPNGTMVLTFINKYFLSLILKNLFHFRWKQAFARLNKIWGGYSPYRHLDSKCYSYSEIKQIFNPFSIVEKRGYSIAFPAWYEHKKFENKTVLLNRLWKLDLFLNKTIFWQLGEYCLYIMKAK